MLTLLFIILPTLAYALGFLKVYRHLGWWARKNCSVCFCYHSNPHCFLSALWDYGWTLVVSLFWPVVAAFLTLKKIYERRGPIKTGFFKPGSLVESASEERDRKESEARALRARIAQLELEAGINQPEPEPEYVPTRRRWSQTVRQRLS